MTPVEARFWMMVMDAVPTLVHMGREKMAQAKKEGLVSPEEQQDRMDRVKGVFDEIED